MVFKKYLSYNIMVLDLFNLNKQVNFYNRYHKNSVNRSIHIICIPVLVWTGEVFFSYIDLNELVIESYSPNILYLCFGIVNFNGASIMSIIYTSYYLILNIKLGIIMYFILYFMQITSYYFYLYIPDVWLIAGLLHIYAWILQLLGHKIFERNRPALKDSLIQSFLTAPIFVLIEILNIYTRSTIGSNF